MLLTLLYQRSHLCKCKSTVQWLVYTMIKLLLPSSHLERRPPIQCHIVPILSYADCRVHNMFLARYTKLCMGTFVHN
jgi:hypothetical protein